MDGKAYPSIIEPNESGVTSLNKSADFLGMGDLDISSPKGTIDVKADGSTGQQVQIDVAVPVSLPLQEIDGGTGQTTYAAGDILYAATTNTLGKQNVGGVWGNHLNRYIWTGSTTLAVGANRQAVINTTTLSEISGFSIDANNIVCPVGTYLITISTTGQSTHNTNKSSYSLTLYNHTDSTTYAELYECGGPVSQNSASVRVDTKVYRVTLAAPKYLQIRGNVVNEPFELTSSIFLVQKIYV